MSDTPAGSALPLALVIDESPSARFVIGKYLATLDCPSASYACLADAAAMLSDPAASQDLRIVFLQMDSAEHSAGVIQALGAYKRLRVVLCASETVPELDQLAQSAGADGVLVKPPSRDVLAALLAKLLPGVEPMPGAAPPAPPSSGAAMADYPPAAEIPAAPFPESAAPVADHPGASTLALEARIQHLEQRLQWLETNLPGLVAEEAQAVSDRLAESILKTLGRA